MNKKDKAALAVAVLLILFVAILLMNAKSIDTPFVDVDSNGNILKCEKCLLAEREARKEM